MWFWLGIGGDDTFVISQDHLCLDSGNDVLRHNRSLTTATRGIYYKGRDAESGCVSAEALNDFDTSSNLGPEMSDSQ